MKTTIIATIMLSVLTCNKEARTAKERPNHPSSFESMKEDVLYQSQELIKDTLVQLQLALIDWSFNEREECETMLQYDTVWAKLYLINGSRFSSYAEKRGIDKETIKQRILYGNLNFDAFSKVVSKH